MRCIKFLIIIIITFCRLNDDDDGAAKVDVVEATTEPTEYQHPDNPKITLVDLPGMGTPNYKDLKTYCKTVDLAEEVKKMGKSFFLVRTKIDNDFKSKKGKSVNEAEILEKIRKYCFENVKNLISSEKEIFLISNYNKEKWDFDRLISAISDALPIRQRECLTLSLSNVTRECLKRKAKIFKGKNCFDFLQ